MITYTAKRIAEEINGTLKADGNISISGIGDPNSANPGEIVCFFDKVDSSRVLPKASLFVVSEDSYKSGLPCVIVDKPKLAFIRLLELFDPYKQNNNSGFASPSAVIGANTKIGKHSKIFANVFIGSNTTIGDKCTIYPNVYIGDNVIIGN